MPKKAIPPVSNLGPNQGQPFAPPPAANQNQAAPHRPVNGGGHMGPGPAEPEILGFPLAALQRLGDRLVAMGLDRNLTWDDYLLLDPQQTAQVNALFIEELNID